MMNPNEVARMDQAGAGMRETSEILASMARPIIAEGVPAEPAFRIALELMQTVLLQYELVEVEEGGDV